MCPMLPQKVNFANLQIRESRGKVYIELGLAAAATAMLEPLSLHYGRRSALQI